MKKMDNSNKIIWKLIAMSFQTAIGVVLIGTIIYLVFSEKIFVSMEGISFADDKYVLLKFANCGILIAAGTAFLVSLGILASGLRKMHDAVEHGIRVWIGPFSALKNYFNL